MKLSTIAKLKRTERRHTPGIAQQTGFPSPATHYLEPTIDLHQELITNADATFYVRVQGDAYACFQIYHNNVLIIDRSLTPAKGALALVVKEGAFQVIRIPESIKHRLQTDFESYILWGTITYIINKAQ